MYLHQMWKKAVMCETQLPITDFEDRGRVYEPKMVVTLWVLEKS